MADDLSRRLSGLSPEQRELLLRRLREKGLAASTAQTPAAPAAPAAEPADAATPLRPIRFSLFFFSEGDGKSAQESYELLRESARFADRHGFAAVWTPERHFQDFGGLYPNPSVLSAWLATATERIGIRAGSVVLPLHDPLRVVEEWAVVDNLSHGRVAVSFASGWHPTDFALSPGTYGDRRELLFRHLETVRRLWAGEAVRAAGVDGREVEVRVLPRPVQPELPVWITCSQSDATWIRAGEVGANVLTIVQPLPVLAEKIARYRAARAARGHDPETGVVSVMLHTFLGEREAAVKEKVREPMRAYLRTYVDQYGFLAGGVQGVRQEDLEDLVSITFENYYATLSLLGTPERCAGVVDRLRAIGVDEAACLIDFGVDAPSILDALPHLERLRQRCEAEPAAVAPIASSAGGGAG